MPAWPQFVGGSDGARTLVGSAAETWNLYVETLPPGGAARAALLPMPGLYPWSTGGQPPVPGGTTVLIWLASAPGASAGRLFALQGPSLVEFGITGTPIPRGLVIANGDPGGFAWNGQLGGQLGIVSGGWIYSFDLATNTLTGPYLTGGYTHIGFAGGLGLAFNPTTGKVNLSALLDFTVWDAGQFFRRSLFGDPWVAMWVDQNNLVWLVGTETFETWYNTGQGTQPFAPLSGLVGALGIVGPWAYAHPQVGNLWLAQNASGQGLLVSTRGSAPEVLSSRAMAGAATEAAHYNALAGAEIVHHQLDAHLLTNVTVPHAPSMGTWCYDHLEQLWTRRGRWDPATGTFGIWGPRAHVMAFGIHLVGDRTTGQLWAMDPAYATDVDGVGIRRLRRAPALVHEKKRAPIDQLELLMDVGLGDQTGQGAAPTILLRVSDDGGRTWSNELSASTGAAGAWRTRVYWTRLGLFNDAVAEISYTDPVPCRLVDAFLNNAEAS